MTTDEVVYARALEGDRAARAELVARYHGPLLAFLYRMTTDQPTAEDLVQETFLRLLTYKGTTPERFRPWVYAVARNLAYDTFRSAAHRHEHAMAPHDAAGLSVKDEPTVETQVQQRADRAAVVDALQALAPHHREALVLRYYHDLSLREIAEITDVPEGTVKSRLYHALKQVKYHLVREEVLAHEGS